MDPPGDGLTDGPAFRQRATGIMQRHAEAVVEAVNELGDLGIVADASAAVPVAPAVPLFTLYVINDAEVFFGASPRSARRRRPGLRCVPR